MPTPDAGSPPERQFGLLWNHQPTPVDGTPTLVRTPQDDLTGPDGAVTHTLVCGDNLPALLALETSLLPPGSVDFCYLDPPYNTGRTAATGFTYKDSFRNATDRERHSTWLSFMYERLVITRRLLSDRGVIAISIDDREVHYLRLLCDEIFGETNFIAQMIVDGGNPKNNARFISTTHEYLLVYAKNATALAKTTKWRTRRDNIDLLWAKHATLVAEHHGDHAQITADLKAWMKTAPLSKRLKVFFNSDDNGLYTYADLSAPGQGAAYPVLHPVTGKPCAVPSRGWGLTPAKMQALLDADMVLFGVDETYQPMRKLYLKDTADQVQRSILAYPSRSSTHLLEKMLGRRNAFNNPKNLDFIASIIALMCPDDGTVLDYFAGSGTTGHAVMKLNADSPTARRRFVLVTNNENNIYRDVTHPRLTAAITGIWLNGTRHTPYEASLASYRVG